MSKHTLGPWEIYKDKFVPTEMAAGSKMYVIQTADDHHDNVGFACSWCDDPENLIEARANANLIAAAPDLLEAPQNMADAYEKYKIDAFLEGELESARAAIAKARGEAK